MSSFFSRRIVWYSMLILGVLFIVLARASAAETTLFLSDRSPKDGIADGWTLSGVHVPSLPDDTTQQFGGQPFVGGFAETNILPMGGGTYRISMELQYADHVNGTNALRVDLLDKTGSKLLFIHNRATTDFISYTATVSVSDAARLQIRPHHWHRFYAVRNIRFERVNISGRDAVGLRIFLNPDGLSASDWYGDKCAARVFQKCGTPEAMVVDGYDGIRDGNSAYVNAANKASDGKMYTNIYLFSLAAGAGPSGADIFSQILKNWRFNTNITDRDDRAALRRDVRRRAQLQSLRRVLAAYQKSTGSAPELLGGSYVRNISFSPWPSWQQTLGSALGGALPIDEGRPYVVSDPADPGKTVIASKNFVGCSAPYDETTCWDERASRMMCPLSAYVHAYRFDPVQKIGKFLTTYESRVIPAVWQGDVLDSALIKSFCSARAGSATEDADRDSFKDQSDNCPLIPNADQRDSDDDGIGDACDQCPFDERNDADGDGICRDIDSCPFAKNIGDSDKNGIDDACDTAERCGNGKKETREECDAGSANGTACAAPRDGSCQYCANACTVATVIGSFCGDGKTDAGAEQCDDGKTKNIDAPTVAYGQTLAHCTTQCQNKTTVGPRCGDGKKNGNEVCDGTDGVGAHQKCEANCTLKNLTHCGDGTVQSPNEEKGVEQCEGTRTDSAECTAGAYKGTKSRSCNASTCQWSSYGDCNATERCGDGKKNGAEQCDSTDGVGEHQRCEANCTLKNLTYCGDGTVQTPNEEGVKEQCEKTKTETIVCGSIRHAYKGTMFRSCIAKTCQWSSYGDCAVTESCGDGKKNGKEVCDGTEGVPTGAQCIKNCSGWVCVVGFHEEGNVCLANTRQCLSGDLPANAAGGTQPWDVNKNTWGACAATSCTAGYREWQGKCERTDCDPGALNCAIPNAQTATRDCNTALHPPQGVGECKARSCKANYYMQNNQCLPNQLLSLTVGVDDRAELYLTQDTPGSYTTRWSKNIGLGNSTFSDMTLVPGRYYLKIRACNTGGPSGTSARLDFRDGSKIFTGNTWEYYDYNKKTWLLNPSCNGNAGGIGGGSCTFGPLAQCNNFSTYSSPWFTVTRQCDWFWCNHLFTTKGKRNAGWRGDKWVGNGCNNGTVQPTPGWTPSGRTIAVRDDEDAGGGYRFNFAYTKTEYCAN